MNNLPRNRLLNVIQKILSVSGTISINELRSGIQRCYRMKGFAPTRSVLREICKTSSFTSVLDNKVSSLVQLDPSLELGEIELMFFRCFEAHGLILDRDTIESECLELGMNANTFGVYLSYSPIIAHVGRAVYSLIGADIPVGTIERIRPEFSKSKVLLDYGWTDQGKIFITYKLSKPTLRAGFVTLPAALSDILTGSHTLYGPAGIVHYGVVKYMSDRVTGLHTFFLRSGAEESDILKLLIDLRESKVRAFLESDEFY